MSDNTKLIDAIDMIDDRYLQKYFSEKEDQNESKKKKTKFSLKQISAAAACLVLAISTAVGILIVNTQKNKPIEQRDNGYSQVKLYGCGEKLYVLDTSGRSGLVVYDTVSKKLEGVVSETVKDFAVFDGDMFYTTGSGLYMKNAVTGEASRILEFTGKKADAIKTVNGEPATETKVKENCTCFNKSGDTVYFLYGAARKISVEDNVVIGEEDWLTVYSLDLHTKALAAVKSAHNVKSLLHDKMFVTDRADAAVCTSDCGIYDLHLYNGVLYYNSANGKICRIDPDGAEDEAIYESDGVIDEICYSSDRCYISEKVVSANATKTYHTTLSLDGKTVISKKEVPADLYETFSRRCYDEKNNVFYAVYGKSIIKFGFDDPADHTVVYTFDKEPDDVCMNLAVIGDTVYYSYYDAVAEDDYYVLKIENGEQEIIIIKSGVPFGE